MTPPNTISITMDPKLLEDTSAAIKSIMSEATQIGTEITMYDLTKFLAKCALGMHLGCSVIVAGVIITAKLLNIRKSRKYTHKGYKFIHLAARSVVTGLFIGLTHPISLPAYMFTGKDSKIFKP